MQALKYAVEEALASLWRGRRASLLSTGTIAIALFVLGCFLLLSANLERVADEWSRAAELSIFLQDNVTETDRQAIEAQLVPGAVVAAVEFVSKEVALQRFREMFGELESAAAPDSNPLPSSLEVRLQPGAPADAVQDLVTSLGRAPGVSDVRYDREWLDRLVSAVRLVRRIGLLLGGVLTLAAALTVANVVRLALHGRRDELDIMQLVGAPTVYLRGPFVAEGVLQGGLGGVAAVAGLAGTFLALRGRYLVPLAANLNISGIQFLSVQTTCLLVLGGMAVGCIGGFLAARGRQ